MPRVQRGRKVVETKFRSAEIVFISGESSARENIHIFVSGYVDFKFDLSHFRDYFRFTGSENA
jgi:hypothetical protein